MNNRRYIIVTIIIAVLSLGLSFVLKPGSSEVAYIHYVDKFYHLALQQYQALWNQGEQDNVNVIVPLAKLYIQEGRIDEAIEVLESYLKTHPEDIAARQRLGMYYQYNQMPYAYLENLEKMQALSPSVENLRELSAIYNSYQLYDKQIAVLQALLEEQEASEEDYINLAYVYSAQGHYQKVMDIIQKLRERKQQELLALGTVEFAVSVYLYMNQPQQAFTLAQQQHDNRIERVLPLARVIREKGYPQLALKLLLPFAEQKQKYPQLLFEYAELEYMLDEQNQLLPVLIQLYEQGRLPEQVKEPFVKLLLQSNQTQYLEKIIKNGDIDLFSEQILLVIVETLIKEKKTQLAQRIRKDLGKAFLQNYPVLDLLLAIGEQDKNLQDEFVRLGKIQNIPEEKRIPVARVCFQIGLSEMTAQLVNSFNADSYLNEVDLYELANLFLMLQQAPSGIKLFTALDKKYPENQKIDAILALFSAAIGDIQKIQQWIARSQPSNQQLLPLYQAAIEFKHAKPALLLAEYMYQQAVTEKTVQYLADAYVLAKQNSDALPLYRKLWKKYHVLTFGYYQALAYSIRDTQDEEQRAEFKSELIQLIAKEFDSTKLSYPERLSIAYLLLEVNIKPPAEEIFLQLAKTAAVDSDEVQQLVFLWGPRPEKKHIDWVKQRINNAEKETYAQWLQILNYMGEASFVMQFVEQNKIPLSPDIYQQYVTALVSAAPVKKLAKVIHSLAEKEKNIKNLEKLAEIAQAKKLTSIEKVIWLKILTLQSQHIKALQTLGRLYYDQAEYSKAKPYLKQLLMLVGGDYLDKYYYAQILWREYHYMQANHLLYQVLAELRKQTSPNVSVQLLQAQVLYQLRQFTQAMALLETLYRTHPNNQQVRENYALMLKNVGQLRAAEKLLSLNN
jgi:predicted Zn-dependent protease